MKKLTWWFRMVGAFYLLLSISNLYAMFLTDGASILAGSPFPVEALTVQVATDYWSVSVFILLGSALFLLWASRDAGAYINVARYVAWLELMGFGAYVLYSLLRGYEPAGYVAFGIVHLLIFATGFLFAREASAETEPTFRPATTD
ncbi:MAG: hypothetical protein M9941_07515 [Anaerolineae bacterium]|nr:hypothetical protein [Anaerolineae bacterium]MCO5197583.1 hypothetical protein [Anaerolineae bacterium]